MGKFWALFDGIADWKRKLIFVTFIFCLAGVLWETNDLLQENEDFFTGERGLVAMQYDEFGDPYAIAKAPTSVPYAKLWSNPITRIGFVFILALVIGSLIRSLVSGSVALVLMILFTAILVSQGAFFDLFNRESTGFFANTGRWMLDQVDSGKSFLLSSFEFTIAAAIGLGIGIFK